MVCGLIWNPEPRLCARCASSTTRARTWPSGAQAATIDQPRDSLARHTTNTRGIGLESAGVELDLRGYVKVNERLETTAPGVWAMGECAGSPQFTHVAYDDFRVVRDNLAGRSRTTRDRLIPYCMFIDPELGRVGLGEREAKRHGIAIRDAETSKPQFPGTGDQFFRMRAAAQEGKIRGDGELCISRGGGIGRFDAPSFLRLGKGVNVAHAKRPCRNQLGGIPRRKEPSR